MRGAAAGLLGGYALLVLGSVVLERWVVYGRTVKPLVVPACLLGGWALARLVSRRPRFAGVACGAIALGAATHFAPHFALVFPREVEAAVRRHYGEPRRALGVADAIALPAGRPVTRPDLVLVNAQVLYPVGGPLPLPAGRTLLRVAHPLEYPPFHYEGYTPRERERLRTQDLSIRLIQVAPP